MTPRQWDNLIYAGVLASACGIAVALMILANRIDGWLS